MLPSPGLGAGAAPPQLRRRPPAPPSGPCSGWPPPSPLPWYSAGRLSCAAALGAAAAAAAAGRAAGPRGPSGRRRRGAAAAERDGAGLAEAEWEWQQRGYADADPKAVPGFKAAVGREGDSSKKWRPGFLVPALQPTDDGADAGAQTRHFDDGALDVEARGPRFRSLPPPRRSLYFPHSGAAQLPLASSLRSMEDIRIQGGKAIATESELSQNACHTPEPYCYTQRPDQRVKKRVPHVPLTRMLERRGMWFEADSSTEQASTSSPQFHGSEVDLRVRCMENGLPVSGTPAQLETRLKLVQSEARRFTMKSMKEDCRVLGLPSDGNRADLEARLLQFVYNPFDDLSVEELHYECSFRGLPADGSMGELLIRLKQYGSKL